MIIDKSAFLLMAGALAAGGAGGWLMRDSKSHHPATDETPVVKTTPETTAQPVTVATQQPVAAAPAPICDDNTGTPADCPAVGPADEGVCTNLAARRCSDFKSAFKPKVATAAVACIRSLKGSEGCDPARVNLCGHEALMAACPDEPAPSSANAAQNGSNSPGAALAVNGAPVAANTLVPNANAAAPSNSASPSPVAQACDQILKSCTGASIAPTLADCRQTLSGMSEFGRANMIQCMAQHCGDKGLLGCEGVKNPTAQAPQ